MKRCSTPFHSMMSPSTWLSSSVSNIFRCINQRSHFIQNWRSFQPILHFILGPHSYAKKTRKSIVFSVFPPPKKPLGLHHDPPGTPQPVSRFGHG